MKKKKTHYFQFNGKGPLYPINCPFKTNVQYISETVGREVYKTDEHEVVQWPIDVSIYNKYMIPLGSARVYLDLSEDEETEQQTVDFIGIPDYNKKNEKKNDSCISNE